MHARVVGVSSIVDMLKRHNFFLCKQVEAAEDEDREEGKMWFIP